MQTFSSVYVVCLALFETNFRAMFYYTSMKY